MEECLLQFCPQVSGALSHWQVWLPQLQAVAKFLHNPHSLQRLVLTCIAGTPFEVYQHKFQKRSRANTRIVHSKFLSWRWGSISSVVADLLPFEELLPRVWDLQKYTQGALNQDVISADESLAFHRVASAQTSLGRDICAVDAAIRSKTFWPYARMIHALNAFAEEQPSVQ